MRSGPHQIEILMIQSSHRVNDINALLLFLTVSHVYCTMINLGRVMVFSPVSLIHRT